MNEFYRLFVGAAKLKAAEYGFEWDPPFDPKTGAIKKTPKDYRWNLSAARNERTGATKWLSSFSTFVKIQSAAERECRHVLTLEWRELLKAVIVDQALIKSNKAQHALDTIGKSIRVIGTVAGEIPPWALTGEIIRDAYNRMIVNSPKGGSNVELTVRTVLDVPRICDASPLARFCIPENTAQAQNAATQVEKLGRRERGYHAAFQPSKLTDRRNADKLPEVRAFWELVRILFTETPKSFADAVKFEHAKIALFSGMRSVEHSSLPLDCLTYREILKGENSSAGKKYAYTRRLDLTNFAAKQDPNSKASRSILVKSVQAVPLDVEEIIIEARDRIEYLTKPLRKRIRQQRKTGRMLPEYEPNQMVELIELYSVMTGNFWFLNEHPPQDLVDQYRSSWSHNDRGKIREHRDQLARRRDSFRAVLGFFSKAEKAGLPVYRDGARTDRKLGHWGAMARIADVEAYLAKRARTKLSDLTSYGVSDGTDLLPEDQLVLIPKRALIEGRNNGILDVDAYFAVGAYHAIDFQQWLDPQSDGNKGIFAVYGETDADRSLSIDSHALRHLKTTELLRHGVVDTATAHHLNRKDPRQNAAYDHRSLLEELELVQVPDQALEELEGKSLDALRLILSGKARGPLVERYYEIAKMSGQREALEFLAAEADGMHFTPYGLCMKSFWIDSCPKHLQCFKGCSHLMKTFSSKNDKYAQDTLVRTESNLERIRMRSSDAPGYLNQVAEAESTIQGLNAFLNAKPGQNVFPDGADLHESIVRPPATVIETGSPLPGPARKSESETLDLFGDG
jgi:hypothetical protein